MGDECPNRVSGAGVGVQHVCPAIVMGALSAWESVPPRPVARPDMPGQA